MTSLSSNSPIRPNTGGGLSPAETVGRDELVADLLTWLVDGSVRIEDPRRIGKTSTLKLLASHATEESPIVYVTVQGYDTVDDIVLEIARALYDHLSRGQRLSDAIKGFFDKASLNAGVVKFEGSLETVDATSKLEQVLAVLSGQFPDGRLIIAVDELPWVISNIAGGSDTKTQGSAAAGAFLQALQRLRVNYPDIRWVLAGSIGFHHVLRLADQTNAVLTGLRPVSCGPLDEGANAELIRRLVAGAGVAPVIPEVVAAINEASGQIPFITHHLVELLAKREQIDKSVVTEVFDEFVLDRGRSAELTHLLQRLDTYMTKEQARLAEVVLDSCALDEPVRFEDIAASTDAGRDDALTIVNWLIDDHYLVERPDGFAWRYGVLRKVWKARRRL